MRFFAPFLASFFLLGSVWATGVDRVYTSDPDHQKNLQKYVQVQQRIMDNYFDVADLNELYQQSIISMVKTLNDSTFTGIDTPLDTTFKYAEPVQDLRESLMRFKTAYEYVMTAYPEQDLTTLTEEAIRGMMSLLDPHSVYIEPDDSERIEEQFAGKFQGIGIQFNIIGDTITVVTAISGGPSDKLGIRSGDRIIEIDDSTAVGFSNEDVIKRLRGEKGTKVDVTIVRPGATRLLDFTITRDDIPLYTVDTHYMLDEQTGYVKINRFAATTHEEFMASVQDLESRGMNRLVLDLQNNPGGYLSQAIAIAEEFFPSGTELVGTISRHNRFTSSYDSRRDGILSGIPVIVLVNEGSASASEIVSGAIQDHDRGLVVGKRTFGKGLVQQQYPLVDESNIRVTISRYYTPSGRVIQKPFINGREEYAHEIIEREHDASLDAEEFMDHVPDSLVFRTRAGRKVYGGGGIVPDFIVKEDTTLSGYLFNFMVANQIDFDFVRGFLDANGSEFREEWGDDFDRFRTEFEWQSDQRVEFIHRLEEAGLIIDNSLSEPKVSGDTLSIPSAYLEETAWMSYGRMKAELARQVWGSAYFYPVINDYFGDSIKQAMELWEAVDRLERYAVAQKTKTPAEGKAVLQ